MRETEFDITQAPEGYLPHRVVAPVYLRQFWDQPIGGPEEPALDGMVGSVLKTYREYRGGGGAAWLARYWPNVRRLMTYIRQKWCEEETGLLIGIQPSTHDIDLAGINSYLGTLWLAALRAAEEMAIRVGEPEWAAEHRMVFERSSASYDEALWNGEYYQQQLRDGDPTDFQWLTGCLSDQLIGQWWAHQLDLGQLLPAERVRAALRCVVRYNLRHDFEGFAHGYRVYADQADAGLLMCSWPLGGRPEVPTRYADEVWTGIEYQVAAHCLWEGLLEEADAVLEALWDRYDGRRRNPYNEIECGDHYARAMAGWTVLEAMAGLRHDEPACLVTVRSGPDAVLPIVTSTGWGHLVREADRLEIVLVSGLSRYDGCGSTTVRARC
ncbi:MAG: GH116 family glycosyl hydrolase [Nakamurella sp.]